MSIVLSISRDHEDVDTYEIPIMALPLSTFLATTTENLNEKDGESEEEEEEVNDGLGGRHIDLPVKFEHDYMTIIQQFLTFFATNTLPLKIKLPITTKSKEDVIHPKILEWLSGFSLNHLSRLRQIVTYFDIASLLEQIDAYLAIEIINNPKEVFKQFHEPTLTLASVDTVHQQFPIMN